MTWLLSYIQSTIYIHQSALFGVGSKRVFVIASWRREGEKKSLLYHIKNALLNRNALFYLQFSPLFKYFS